MIICVIIHCIYKYAPLSYTYWFRPIVTCCSFSLSGVHHACQAWEKCAQCFHHVHSCTHACRRCQESCKDWQIFQQHGQLVSTSWLCTGHQVNWSLNKLVGKDCRHKINASMIMSPSRIELWSLYLDSFFFFFCFYCLTWSFSTGNWICQTNDYFLK